MEEENVKEVIEDEKTIINRYEDWLKGYTDATEELTSNKKRWYKSWAVWVAIAGLISIILTTFNVWQYIGIDSETFDGIITAVGGVLTAFGVINNPTVSGQLE